jgi:SHS2 domain-containing protein
VDFEYFDHTADIGVKAYGETLPRMFENAARGMVGIIYEILEEGGEKVSRNVELTLTEDNREQLLIDWLNEVLFILETEGFIPTKFDVTQLTDRSLKALIHGSPLDPRIHRYKTEVKSTTYHMLEIGRENDIYSGTILFDI